MSNSKTKQEILRAHYVALLKKFGTWAGLVSLVTASLIAVPVQAAGQLTDRKTTLGSSAASASTTYDFTFKPATTATIKAIKFQVCTSPLEQTSCTASNSSSMSGGSYSTAAPTTLPTAASWAAGTSGLAPSATSFWIVYNTGDSLTSGTSYTVRLSSITNPNVANTSFYTRITTYSDVTATTAVDYGAMAVSTANQVAVSANVQESLTFCVYTNANCGAGGSSVNLGTGTDNVLSASSPTGGVSKMDVSTNATSGYIITYVTSSPGGTGGTACAGSLSSSNDCITDFGGTAGTFSAGTAKFGLNLKDNATPDIGAEVSGSGGGTASAPYATVDSYAFQGGLTPRTVASASGPSLSNTFTVAYAAQAGNTTKPGAYSATFTWVATGTF